MKITFELIKQIISILSTATMFVSFIVTTLCTNKKSPKFIEYTDLSKSFLNIYIGLLLLLMLCHSINPKMVCTIFTDRIGIIASDRGKITLSILIIIMYFSTESMPQKLFGMISFVCVFALILFDFFLNCDTLKQKPLINENIGNNRKRNSNDIPTSQAVITITNNSINNSLEKKD